MAALKKWLLVATLIVAPHAWAAPAPVEADTETVGSESKIPIVINRHVKKWIHYFTVKDRERFQRFLNRGDGYRQVVEDMLEENDLPAELYYLAMIESGFRTDAHSLASAVGVWQFIPGTATRYGLRVDSEVDERRDPIRATESAAKYLKDLYNVFGSWHLAMAAYNAGEIRVLRAVFKGKSRDFWTLVERGALPSETADYVPKFIAVTLIGQDPERYGFKVSANKKFPDVEAVEVPSNTSLERIASLAGMSATSLSELNPALRHGRTPRGADYEIWVPAHSVARVERVRSQARLIATQKPDRALKAQPGYHIVRRGETLSAIASRYKVSLLHLKRMNGLASGEVMAGTRLRLTPRQYKESTIVRHKVRRGDNLVRIADRYGVSVSQIKHRNKLRRNRLFVGEILKISPHSNL